MTATEIRAARQSLGLTQKAFGALLHAKLRTVEDWEAGKRNMTGATEELLNIKIKEMKMKYQVYANAADFGIIEAEMETRLESHSEIVAKEI